MFPGSFYLIGMWYKRSEAQKRYSFFFGSTSLAGAFGGLLASAIGKMDGVQGYLGWRWIFILEGLLTCVVAFIFFFVIPDFPENAKWLTEEERQYVQLRLRKEQGRSAAERPIGFKDIVNVFKDYKVMQSRFVPTMRLRYDLTKKILTLDLQLDLCRWLHVFRPDSPSLQLCFL